MIHVCQLPYHCNTDNNYAWYILLYSAAKSLRMRATMNDDEGGPLSVSTYILSVNNDLCSIKCMGEAR